MGRHSRLEVHHRLLGPRHSGVHNLGAVEQLLPGGGHLEVERGPLLVQLDAALEQDVHVAASVALAEKQCGGGQRHHRQRLGDLQRHERVKGTQEGEFTGA